MSGLLLGVIGTEGISIHCEALHPFVKGGDTLLFCYSLREPGVGLRLTLCASLAPPHSLA